MQICARGYDEGPSDTVGGVVDVCFPVFDQLGVIAALNVVYLEQRDAKASVPQARQALAETAEAISRALGWIPSGRRKTGAVPSSKDGSGRAGLQCLLKQIKAQRARRTRRARSHTPRGP